MISHRSPLGSAGFRLNTLRRLTPDLIPPPPLRGGRGRSLFRFSLRLAGRSRGGGLGPAKGQATTRPSLPPGAAPETGSPPRRGRHLSITKSATGNFVAARRLGGPGERGL